MGSGDRPVKRRRKRDGEDRNLDSPVRSPRDPSGKWRRKVDELADRLGWERPELWWWYDQMSCLAEFELRIPRHIAEHTGYRLLRESFDKVEMGMDEN